MKLLLLANKELYAAGFPRNQQGIVSTIKELIYNEMMDALRGCGDE